VRDYRPRLLAQEVADLIVALDAGAATVAGHDWGGGLAWLLAMHHPERVERLVVLNAPHPIRFLKGLRSRRQLRRSWYMLAFQAPCCPSGWWRPGTSGRLTARTHSAPRRHVHLGSKNPGT
jgi:pimeloyl-ACP methyl ester carboxylesterase